MEKQIDERECASVTAPRFLFFFRDINRTDSVDRRRLIDVMFCDVKARMSPIRFPTDFCFW